MSTRRLEAHLQELQTIIGFWARYYSRYARPPVDYDDLVQEGMIGALAALREYTADAGASLRTYASLRIRRQIYHALRRFEHWDATVRVERHENTEAIAAALGGSTCDQPRLLLDVVAQLPHKERLTVTLHYYGGRDFDEVAELVGVQHATALILHRDALRRLRRILGVPEPAKQEGPAPASGLTAEQIVEMRELRAQGWLYGPLAERFGITGQHCRNICTGRYWPDAGEPIADLRDCQSYQAVAPKVVALREQGMSQRGSPGQPEARAVPRCTGAWG
jgi:RNA polymerase sigma factor (sigma-70 family)